VGFRRLVAELAEESAIVFSSQPAGRRVAAVCHSGGGARPSDGSPSIARGFRGKAAGVWGGFAGVVVDGATARAGPPTMLAAIPGVHEVRGRSLPGGIPRTVAPLIAQAVAAAGLAAAQELGPAPNDPGGGRRSWPRSPETQNVDGSSRRWFSRSPVRFAGWPVGSSGPVLPVHTVALRRGPRPSWCSTGVLFYLVVRRLPGGQPAVSGCPQPWPSCCW